MFGIAVTLAFLFFVSNEADRVWKARKSSQEGMPVKTRRAKISVLLFCGVIGVILLIWQVKNTEAYKDFIIIIAEMEWDVPWAETTNVKKLTE